MKKVFLKLLALCLTAALLLSGCDIADRINQLKDRLNLNGVVAYDDMVYTRPDMDALESLLSDACAAAAESKSIDAVLDAIWAYYDAYDSFYTNYNLADLHYCSDLTDSYWEEEYNFCAENVSAADAGLDALYYALAKSKLVDELEDEYFGDGYFDAYQGESMWDADFMALMEQESELLVQYYALCDEAMETEYYSDDYFTTYGPKLTDVYVRLVKLRQQIAAQAGYPGYAEFAYDFYYYRDYTPAQAKSYLQQVETILIEPYRKVNDSDVWDAVGNYCSENATFRYVKSAAQAMGGTVKDAFSLLENAKLYDIAYGENKYDSSFELYLWSYQEPFIFMCPYMDQSDKLTFAHEFGHFANDYACGGSYAGTDIAEVHSQAFEYLSLCYVSDTDDLVKYKMADSLCTYMEQAAYAMFELQVYELAGSELTAENVMALYEKTGTAFGFDSWNWDSRDFVTVPHFFTDPMYTISYVVSNDLAMQFYQLEQENKGAGLTLYEQCLQSEESYIITFADQYGLESPFAPGRLQKVAETFRNVLG